jgi:hypothetical protein
MNKKLQKRKNNKNRRGRERPDIPFSQPRFSRGTQLVTMQLYLDVAAVSSSGAGVINLVQNINFTQMQTEAQYAGVFDECRILHGRIDFVPLQVDAVIAATLYSDMIGVVDYDSSAALTTYNQAAAYDTARHFWLNKPGHLMVKPMGAPDLNWVSTGAGSDIAWVKFYSSGLSATVTYGRLYGSFTVQFRMSY